jgi:aminopeptidase-like protein
MNVTESAPSTAANVGAELYSLIAELYPICRSITGGVRETLRRIRERIPLDIGEVPFGTRVFDWTVPREWNIRDAWIKNVKGGRVVDFRISNLHVVSYSLPVRTRMPLSELRHHLYCLPDHPTI